MLPGPIPMAHSGQSDYWGVCIDIKDRDNTGSSAVPVTQQTEYSVWSTSNVSQSVLHWLIEKPSHKKRPNQFRQLIEKIRKFS